MKNIEALPLNKENFKDLFSLNFLTIIIIFILTLQTPVLADDIRDFQIEGMSIGDSALGYFNEAQLEDSEQGWHNYNYEEYSTSLLPGKNIYHWIQVSYKNNDSSFKIEALSGILEKKNYDNLKCNKDLNTITLNILELFENTNPEKKQSYTLTKDEARKYPFTGNSTVTSVSFNFPDKGEIVLACYNKNKTTGQNDSFRIEIRSNAFANYLKKN